MPFADEDIFVRFGDKHVLQTGVEHLVKRAVNLRFYQRKNIVPLRTGVSHFG